MDLRFYYLLLRVMFCRPKNLVFQSLLLGKRVVRLLKSARCTSSTSTYMTCTQHTIHVLHLKCTGTLHADINRSGIIQTWEVERVTFLNLSLSPSILWCPFFLFDGLSLFGVSMMLSKYSTASRSEFKKMSFMSFSPYRLSPFFFLLKFIYAYIHVQYNMY